MAKYVYNDFRPEFQKLRFTDLQETAELLAQKARQVNQRFYRLEKAGFSKDTAYIYAQAETGKEKPRYTTSVNEIKKMSDAERVELAFQLHKKLESATSTISGLQELYKKRLSTSKESLSEKANISFEGIPDYEWDEFLRNGGGELMNNKFLASTQIVEDWLEMRKKGVSTADFMKEFNRQKKYFSKHPQTRKYGESGQFRPDYGAMKRKWNKLK